MESDDVRRSAIAAGLPDLEPKYLAELARSLEASRQLTAELPTDLHWSEEIALVFQLPGSVAGGRR